MLTPFVVFLLGVGCVPIAPHQSVTYHYSLKAQVDPNQESVRLITQEESTRLTSKEGTDIVELTNSQFKMLVYFEDPYLKNGKIIDNDEET